MATEEEFDNQMKRLMEIWSDKKVHKGRLPQAIKTLGYLESAKKIVITPGETGGFKKLVDGGWWNLTVEALILRVEYRDLFTPEEIAMAEEKLRPHR